VPSVPPAALELPAAAVAAAVAVAAGWRGDATGPLLPSTTSSRAWSGTSVASCCRRGLPLGWEGTRPQPQSKTSQAHCHLQRCCCHQQPQQWQEQQLQGGRAAPLAWRQQQRLQQQQQHLPLPVPPPARAAAAALAALAGSSIGCAGSTCRLPPAHPQCRWHLRQQHLLHCIRDVHRSGLPARLPLHVLQALLDAPHATVDGAGDCVEDPGHRVRHLVRRGCRGRLKLPAGDLLPVAADRARPRQHSPASITGVRAEPSAAATVCAICWAD